MSNLIDLLARLGRVDISGIYQARIGVMQWQNDIKSGEQLLLQKILPAVLADVAVPVVFDVGLNEGNYSAKILKSFPLAKIHGFEPSPLTFQRALNRFKSVSNIRVENLALSSEVGVMKLFDYALKDGSSHASLYSEVLTEQHKSDDVIYWEVRVLTIDEYIKINSISEISFLKIDTEGHELDVLSGSTDLIASGAVRAVQFEFNEMNVMSRSFLRDFYKQLPDHKFFRLRTDGLVPLGDYDAANEIFKFQNILALTACDVKKVEPFIISNPWK